MPLPDPFGDKPFVQRVQVGENHADGDGFHAGQREFVQYPVQCFFIHGGFDGAVGADAFRQCLPQGPRNQWLDRGHPQIVPVFFQPFPERQQIPEALGGDQADPGSFSLQERVGRDGGAVNEQPDPGHQFGRGEAMGFGDVAESVHHRVGRRLGRRRRLEVARRGITFHHDEIRECPADVDAYGDGRFGGVGFGGARILGVGSRGIAGVNVHLESPDRSVLTQHD